MRKYFLLFILLLSVVQGITIDRSEFDETVVELRSQNFSIAVTYDNQTEHNFTIYNVTFKDVPHFTFYPIHNLSMNETKIIDMSVRANDTFNMMFLSKLKYYYLT